MTPRRPGGVTRPRYPAAEVRTQDQASYARPGRECPSAATTAPAEAQRRPAAGCTVALCETMLGSTGRCW